VVERHRDRPGPSNDNLTVPHDRPRSDTADAENRHLRVVDDRRGEEAGELPRARHGEGRAANLLGLQRALACAVGKTSDLRVDLLHRLRVAAPDHRDDEALFRLDGHSDVVAVEVDDLVPLEARVQLRELAEGVGARLHDCRHEELHGDTLEVALLDPRDGRHFAMGARHVLGDEAPDAAQLLSSALGRRCGGCAHVLLGDPASRPGARHRGEVHGEVLSDLADQGCRRDSRGDCPRGGLSSAFSHRRHLRDDFLSRLPDHDEHRSDGRDLSLADENPQNRPRIRGRDLDRRLVRLDLDERIVFRDLLSLGDEPACDLALGEALSQIGKLEGVRH